MALSSQRKGHELLPLTFRFFKQMFANVTDDLTDFKRFFFDELRPLESIRSEFLEIHEFRVVKHHPDSIIQIVQQPSHQIRIHGAPNLPQPVVSCGSQGGITRRRIRIGRLQPRG